MSENVMYERDITKQMLQDMMDGIIPFPDKIIYENPRKIKVSKKYLQHINKHLKPEYHVTEEDVLKMWSEGYWP